MNKSTYLFPFFIVLTLICFPKEGLAVVESYYSRNYTSGDIVIINAADSMAFATVLAGSGIGRQVKICSNNTINYSLRRVDYVPVASYLGQTYSSAGSSVMYLFDTGAPGFALIPFYNVSSNAAMITYGQTVRTTVWSGNYDNGARVYNGIPTTYGSYIWKGSDRPNDGYTLIPGQEMFRFECYDETNTLQEIIHISTGSANVRASIRTCTPNVVTASVDMGAVAMSSLLNSAASQLINTQQVTFSLVCDPSIALYYSVSDLNNPANRSTITSLTSDSTASGIGFTLTNSSGTQLSFGPDGSAKDIPGQTKYFIGNSGGVVGSDKNLPMALTLGFSYVRDTSKDLKSGTAKSLIGITYSYQ